MQTRPDPQCMAIFVLGPSSSGKTTLCNALADTLHIPPPMYIKEVARTVMKTHGFTRDDVGLYKMQLAIMEAQLGAETDAISFAVEHCERRPLVLSDRSAIDPAVYAATSTVPGEKQRSQRLLQHLGVQERLPFYRKSLFVVLESIPEWMEDDGVRSLDDPQKYTHALRSVLEDLEVPYMTLGGATKDLNERVSHVIDGLERMNRDTNQRHPARYTL